MQRSLATGLFKWSADVPGAARAFGKAGTSYKAARAPDRAKVAFLREAAALGQGDLYVALAALVARKY
jgi:hypothetical protein